MVKSRINTQILSYFLSWRLATIVFTFFLINLVEVKNPLTNSDESLILRLWNSWDGGHYIGITLNGYAHLQQFAFFPFYPIVIKTLTFLGFSPYLASLLISNSAFLGALFILEKLARFYDFNTDQINKTIIMIITFPTAFFFLAAYNESLLLFLSLSALYFAKRKLWFLASICVGLASFTKVIGITLVPLLIFELFTQNKLLLKQSITKGYTFFESLFYLLTFGLSGFYLYAYYLYYRSGNPFLFIKIQSYWGRTSAINNPITVLSESVTNFVLPNGTFSLSIQSLEVLIIFAAILLFPFVTKRFGIILGLYTLFLSVFTLLSGKTDSSLRYILTAFPLFLLFGQWATNSKIFFYTYITTGLMLQALLLTLFLMGHWVG